MVEPSYLDLKLRRNFRQSLLIFQNMSKTVIFGHFLSLIWIFQSLRKCSKETYHPNTIILHLNKLLKWGLLQYLCLVILGHNLKIWYGSENKMHFPSKNVLSEKSLISFLEPSGLEQWNTTNKASLISYTYNIFV